MANASGKVRWGILTSGRIAHTFARDIQQVSNAELVAVAARRHGDAQAFAAEHGIACALEGYEALYQHSDVDAIYIASPHSFHLEQACAAIGAGKAVLCEKPITLNGSQCQRLTNAAREGRVFLMEAMWSYFLPAIVKAQEWVAQGRLGTITQVKCDFGYPIAYDPELREWDAALGGGCLLEMGIYPVALAQLFAPGVPERLNVSYRLAPNGAESDLSWVADHGDILVTLGTSFRAKLPNVLYVIGTEGWIEVPDAWRASEARFYQLETCVDHFVDRRSGSGFEFQIQAASADILAGNLQSDVVSQRHSQNCQDYMDRIRRAWL